jgi:hypothetical protein
MKKEVAIKIIGNFCLANAHDIEDVSGLTTHEIEEAVRTMTGPKLTRSERNFLKDAMNDYWDAICSDEMVNEATERRLANTFDRVWKKLF